MIFRLGYEPQVLELGGVKVESFGKAIAMGGAARRRMTTDRRRAKALARRRREAAAGGRAAADRGRRPDVRGRRRAR